MLDDIWFASEENMKWVKNTLHKDLVMPLKANCKVMLSETAKRAGTYQQVDTLELEPLTPITKYLGRAEFPLLLI